MKISSVGANHMNGFAFSEIQENKILLVKCDAEVLMSKYCRLLTPFRWLNSFSGKIIKFDEVERKPNFGCDFAELGVLCRVIFWKTHIPVRTSFLQGHVTA